MVNTRRFAVPILVDEKRRDEVEALRVYVSENRGHTWTHTNDYKPTDKQIEFFANRDDVYWFAIQLVKKDGTISPAAKADLVPAMKVQVNPEKKVFELGISYIDLLQEVEQLRRTVQRLEKRLHELEAERKSK